MRAEPRSSGLIDITKASVKDFSTDQCTLRAAALSYFTVFALPPLLVLLIMLAGLIWSPQSVQHALESQFAGLVGSGGAAEVRQMIISGQRSSHGLFGTVLGFVGMIAGATGAFLSLQEALNAVWQVGPESEAGRDQTIHQQASALARHGDRTRLSPGRLARDHRRHQRARHGPRGR